MRPTQEQVERLSGWLTQSHRICPLLSAQRIVDCWGEACQWWPLCGRLESFVQEVLDGRIRRGLGDESDG